MPVVRANCPLGTFPALTSLLGSREGIGRLPKLLISLTENRRWLPLVAERSTRVAQKGSEKIREHIRASHESVDLSHACDDNH